MDIWKLTRDGNGKSMIHVYINKKNNIFFKYKIQWIVLKQEK